MRACLGTLISEFTILRSFLNCVQSLGSLDLHYLILELSRSCIRFFISDVIQGELRARTSIVLRGACLSRIDRNNLFPCNHISFGLVEQNIYFGPNTERQYHYDNFLY